MGLSTTREIIEAARDRGVGVGAFNAIGLEHAEGIVAGAEAARRPVVLQLSENTVAFHGGRLAPIGLACLALARSSLVPVAVHLDHATSPELCSEAAAIGLSSFMYDASRLSYQENLAATATMAELSRRNGMWIEAELGEIGGKDGVHSPTARTDPREAAGFVEATGVDALAVAVGTSHGMLRAESRLDLDLLAQLRDQLPVPLVLHGSSGVSDDELQRAVVAGIVKVNVGTQLNLAFTGACRGALTPRDLVDPRRFLGPGRDAVAGVVARLLQVVAVQVANPAGQKHP